MKRWIKKHFRPPWDKKVIVFFIFLPGAIALTLGIVFSIQPLTGIGTSLIGGSIINLLLDMQFKDPVTSTTLEALREMPRDLNRVRRNQEIILNLSTENGKVIVETTHIFEYENIKQTERTYPLRIFSDFRCGGPFSDGEKYDFYFAKIDILKADGKTINGEYPKLHSK